MKNKAISSADLEQIKQNIKKECKERKIKISTLCTSISKDRFYIAQMTNPSAGTLINIAVAIGCLPSDLLKDI